MILGCAYPAGVTLGGHLTVNAFGNAGQGTNQGAEAGAGTAPVATARAVTSTVARAGQGRL